MNEPIYPVISTQVAFYLKETIKPDDLWFAIKKDTDELLFSSAPIIFPLPADSELDETPSVIISGKEGLSLNIARRRIDLILVPKKLEDFSQLSEGFNKDVVTISNVIFSYLSKENTVNRFGFLTRFFYEQVEPNTKLSAVFSDNIKILSPKQSLKNIALQFCITSRFINIDVQNFFSFKSAHRNFENKKIPGIQIERDFNTMLQKTDFSMNVKSVKEFMKKSEKLFDFEKISQIL